MLKSSWLQICHRVIAIVFLLLIFFGNRYPACSAVTESAFVMQMKDKRILSSVYTNRLKLTNNLLSEKLRVVTPLLTSREPPKRIRVMFQTMKHGHVF